MVMLMVKREAFTALSKYAENVQFANLEQTMVKIMMKTEAFTALSKYALKEHVQYANLEQTMVTITPLQNLQNTR